MKNTLLFGVFLVAFSATAQEKVNPKELQKLSSELQMEYKKAIQLEERKYGEHTSDEGVSFQGFSQGIPNYFSSDSQNQRISMNVDKLGDNTIPGVAVTGDGMTAYIWDGGRIRLTHNEFSGRAVEIETTGSSSDHASGVGSVIIGSGAMPIAKGMAPTANLKVLNFTQGSTTMEMADQSALPENAEYMVSNHSYGSLVGWSYRSNNSTWYWYGYPDISPTESALFGFYTSTDATYDDIAFQAPQHSIFKSAGNNRGEGPGETVDHYAFNNNNGWVFYSGVDRPDDCTATGGYDCLAFSGSVAKNIISVGAISPMQGNGQYNQPSDLVPTYFTSFGPTDDGRIKPEVVAIGQNVRGANNNADNGYTNWAGTSFSSPAGAGVGLLLQQVKKEYDGTFLRSDMMKALLVNTAKEGGEFPGPDYKFGYGLIDALGAAQTILNSEGSSYIADMKLENNENYSISFKAIGDQPIVATISWLDPAGTPLNTVVLNDRTPMLVNDLDLRITHNGTIYYPWKLNPDDPAAAATQEDNSIDNTEQIFIENPVAGETYSFQISHKGNLVNGNQYYALVINGVESHMNTLEVDVNNAIQIYPNPVMDKLNIKTSMNLKNVQIRIFDSMGQSAYLSNLNSFNNTMSIDLNHLPAGVYMVHIKSDEGIMTKKIIKK